MYKLVQTAEDERLFNELYKQSFSEKNYELDDYYKGECFSYLVANKFGQFAGTLQFAPYRPHTKRSTLNEPTLFLEVEDVAQHIDTIWEVDKVTVRREDGRNGVLNNIVETIKEVTQKYGVTHLVSEMNPVFCRALKIQYQLDVMKVRQLVHTKQYAYVPVVISTQREAHKLQLATAGMAQC